MVNTTDQTQNEIIPEDISIETLHVLNAIKTSFSHKIAEESKDLIYEKTCRNIDFYESTNDSKKVKRIKKFLQLSSIAIACLLVFIPLSFIIYTKGYNSASSEIADEFIELRVPQGATSSITLSDSTLVILNGGSRLIYPTRFKKERKVTLVGEAFFDVTKNKDKPFFVHTPNLTAKVLGTQFNFKAYEKENKTILTLKKGSIYAIPAENAAIEGLILKPSQQIIVDNYTKEMMRRNVSVQDFISWKDGIITFRDNTLDEIRILLERQFNIPILITTEDIRKERYSAQFKHGENLRQILDKLSHKRGWKYKFENEQIKISSIK